MGHESSIILFTLIIAAVVAELEIQIEGKDGWAGKLPTWRINNKYTSFVLGGSYHPLTGYHFFLGTLVFIFFHFPFFVGDVWSPAFEFQIISAFFLFWMVEDFLWFVFNPRYGIRRFKEGEIPWHKRWVLGVPFSYYKFLAVCALFYALSIVVQ